MTSNKKLVILCGALLLLVVYAMANSVPTTLPPHKVYVSTPEDDDALRRQYVCRHVARKTIGSLTSEDLMVLRVCGY